MPYIDIVRVAQHKYYDLRLNGNQLSGLPLANSKFFAALISLYEKKSVFSSM